MGQVEDPWDEAARAAVLALHEERIVTAAASALELQPFMLLAYGEPLFVIWAEDSDLAIEYAGWEGVEPLAARIATAEEVAESDHEDRLAMRRLRYAKRKEAGLVPSRAKSNQPELSWSAMISAVDANGRLRCARGHFTTADQLVNSPTGAAVAGGMVDFAPTCARCRAKLTV